VATESNIAAIVHQWICGEIERSSSRRRIAWRSHFCDAAIAVRQKDSLPKAVRWRHALHGSRDSRENNVAGIVHAGVLSG
jgi:hypothetical protein